MPSEVERIKKTLLAKQQYRTVKTADLLSTGSTMLNLACSGKATGGLLKGHYYFFCGDSASGKTWIGLTCFAEACLNSAFDDYRLIYDGVEGGALMNIERFFGSKVAERLEPPSWEKGEPRFSETVQDFYYHVDDAERKGVPFIYVLDSQDALTSDEEVKKFDQQKRARRKVKTAEDDGKVPGSYGDAKAKYHSSHIRKVLRPLQTTGSILLMLNQTRDSFSMFEKSSYSGGRALKFYATLQLWSKVREHITKTVMGKKRELGIVAQVRVRKNRMTGRDRTIEIPIYHSCGIDDVGSMIAYLVSEGVWKNKKGMVTATGIGPALEMRWETLIRHIEQNDLWEDVVELVEQTWHEVEKACQVKRKRRYE